MAITTFAVDTQLTPAPIGPIASSFSPIETQAAPGNAFSTFFNAAINMVNDTNVHQIEADMLQLDFATGRIDDILAVQLAQDRAFNSLNFTVQVTNRIIEAYREIMRMQM